ncbi:MAG: endonuclease/exonuclease/phosphatase family protein [Deltaproteobacteria bacterium]|nr:endonuclease/exonuclease/phosphatase family protein [Deltaproteobacteria bacterium]
MHRPASLAFALILIAACVTGCANRGLPVDPSIEATFPRHPLVGELPRELRVVTFNVHGEPAEVVAGALQRDRQLREADVIVLQEVQRIEPLGAARSASWCSAACGIGKLLGFHAVYAAGHAIPGGSHGVAILSRAPITSAQVLELPFFDVVFNSGRRVVLAATLEVAGTPVTVYAVHLDNRLTVRDRRTQVLPVLAHAARQPTPVIIAGDFNTSPFTWLGHVVPILTTTQDNRLEALVRAFGFQTPVTASGPTHRVLAMRLDAIYTRGFETTKFAVSDADDVSDHLALWAQLRAIRRAPVRAPDPRALASAE